MFHVSGNCDYANDYSIVAVDSNERGVELENSFLRDGTVPSIKSIPENSENEN